MRFNRPFGNIQFVCYLLVFHSPGSTHQENLPAFRVYTLKYLEVSVLQFNPFDEFQRIIRFLVQFLLDLSVLFRSSSLIFLRIQSPEPGQAVEVMPVDILLFRVPEKIQEGILNHILCCLLISQELHGIHSERSVVIPEKFFKISLHKHLRFNKFIKNPYVCQQLNNLNQ